MRSISESEIPESQLRDVAYGSYKNFNGRTNQGIQRRYEELLSQQKSLMDQIEKHKAEFSKLEKEKLHQEAEIQTYKETQVYERHQGSTPKCKKKAGMVSTNSQGRKNRTEFDLDAGKSGPDIYTDEFKTLDVQEKLEKRLNYLNNRMQHLSGKLN